MDTIRNINGAQICEIIIVKLDDILLELLFNLEHLNGKLSFKLSISDDGESIVFYVQEKWDTLADFSYESYQVHMVKDNGDDLSRLLGLRILSVKFGVGTLLDSESKLLYYAKIVADKSSFLFFNNGDAGAYSFDKIEEILENDIYGYKWMDKPC